MSSEPLLSSIIPFAGSGAAGDVSEKNAQISHNNYRLISWCCLLSYSMDVGASIYPRTG
jgi:hypothetical protein